MFGWGWSGRSGFRSSREEPKESKPLWLTPLADSNSPQGSTAPTASGWAPQDGICFFKLQELSITEI